MDRTSLIRLSEQRDVLGDTKRKEKLQIPAVGSVRCVSLDVPHENAKEAIPRPSWEGLELKDGYKLCDFLRADSHADVYSVSELHPSEHGIHLEARVYKLGGLNSKLHTYRLRNLMRLASRQVVKEERGEHVVVVYYTGYLEGLRAKGLVEKIGSEESAAKAIAARGQPRGEGPRTGGKSSHQIESARLRQRDRRRRKRHLVDQAKVESQSSASSTHNESGINQHQGSEDIERNTWAILRNLTIAFNPLTNLPKVQDKLSLEWKEYHKSQNEGLRFKNAEDIEEFMQIRMEEKLFLTRTEKQLPEMRQQCHKDLLELLEKQRALPRDSAAWAKMQVDAVEPMKEKLRVLGTASSVLREEIKKAKKKHRSLRQALIWTEGSRAEERIANYRAWTRQVLPGTEAYTHLLQKLAEAEASFRWKGYKTTDHIESSRKGTE